VWELKTGNIRVREFIKVRRGEDMAENRVVTDPNDAGLKPEVVLRLLSCNNKPKTPDRVKYEKSEHFEKVKSAVQTLYKVCVLCGASKNLVTHHRNYRNLFREHLTEDVTLLCQRCHGRYHRGHRGSR